MREIVYYPLSIKRLGRLIYLFFYFISGLALIYFALFYKQTLDGFFSIMYLIWGASFMLYSILFSIPYVFQKINLIINEKGISQRTSFFKKEQFVTWAQIKEIKVVGNRIEFGLGKSQLFILTEKMNPEDKRAIINSIKFHVNGK